MPEILEIIRRYGYITDSVITGHIDVKEQEGVPCMVEIAAHFRIPRTAKVFTREVYGVTLPCAADDKNATLETCYDNAEWNEELGDMVIPYPLPEYASADRQPVRFSANIF